MWPGWNSKLRIRSMAVYKYSEQEVEHIIRAQRRLRLRFCAAVAIILIAAFVVASTRPELIFGAQQHARGWVIATLFVFFVGPLGENLFRWRSRSAKLRESLRASSVEVTEQWVRTCGSFGTRQLSRAEIQRAEEVPWGLYLRTQNRYRWLLLPSKMSAYRELKAELERLQIPTVQAATAPNWEEFAGVLVFTGTIFCAIFAHSARVLAVNLLIALAVAIAGFGIVSANPDNLPKMRWARLGIFLPVVMTASMLWLALRK